MTAKPRTLADWLAHAEALHPQAVDLALERVQRVRERLGIAFTAPVISVAGTNGKGSTCAMIESIARAAGYRVGLYTKPHLVHFEERCRIDGAPVAAAALLPHFEAVETERGGEPLTWFEFTTLVILRALAAAPLDLVILEVGLGGRLDAVNVIDADVAVLTSIAIDHVAWLGPDRESIGREKAHIMRRGRFAIVADPAPPASVLEVARAIGARVQLAGRDFHHEGDRRQWHWIGPERRFRALAWPALRGANQLLNAAGAIAALEALHGQVPISAQAVRRGLAEVELPGRFQIVPGQPVLVLDVAHNEQAVATLAASLDAMGFFPRTLAVFGAMHDKALAAMLTRIAPLIDVWHLCDLATARAARAVDLAPLARAAAGGRAVPVHTHPGAPEALRAALAEADPADRILVFGSFYAVGAVLAAGLPRSGVATRS